LAKVVEDHETEVWPYKTLACYNTKVY